MRGMKFCIVLVLLLSCCSFIVSGLGVSPAGVNFVYDKSKGLDETFDIRIVASSPNTKFVDIGLVEYNTPFGVPEGTVILNTSQMSEYVTLSDTSIDVTKANTIRVKIKIPPNADVYGPNWFGIQLRERPEGEGGFFAVTTAIWFRIIIDASYPGQYLDITKFNINNINEGESSKLYWQVKGRGEQDTPFIAGLEILSDKNVSVFKRDLGGGSVKRMEVYPADSFYESLPTNAFTPGVYTGLLTVKFLDTIKKSSVKFNVGAESVALDDYNPKTLVLGNINEVKLNVRNLWNGQFNNVYGVIVINGANATEIKTTTPSDILPPFGTVELKQFIDTRSLPEGNYSAMITIHFDESSNVFPAQFAVAKEIVPLAEAPKKGISSKVLMIGGITLGVLILLVLIFLLLSRKNKIETTHKENAAENIHAQVQQVKSEIKPERKQQSQQSKMKK